MIKRENAFGGGGNETIESPPIGMFYRGEWNTVEAYDIQSVTSVFSGSGKGLFVALQAVSAGESEPYLNSKWSKIGDISAAEVFL